MIFSKRKNPPKQMPRTCGAINVEILKSLGFAGDALKMRKATIIIEPGKSPRVIAEYFSNDFDSTFEKKFTVEAKEIKD